MASLLQLASCSSDDADNGIGGSQSKRLIPVNEVKTLTRAAQNVQTGTVITSGNTAGFFITDGSVTENDELTYDNMKMTADGNGNFTGDTQLYFPLSESAGVYAYTPYSEDAKLSDGFTFSVKTDQNLDADYLQSDLLIGAPESNPVAASSATDGKVNVKFSHKLAKVNLNVSSEITGTDLSTSTVKIMNTQTSCTVNVKEGTIVATGSTATITAATYTAAQDAYKCAAIVVPQTIASGKQFVGLEIGESGSAQKLYVRLSDALTLEAGHEYTFNVVIKKDQIAMTLANQLDEWTNGGTLTVNPTEEDEDVPDREPQVGDWYTAAGKFVDGASAVPDNVIGIVFNTTDAPTGYKAYVTALTDKANKEWGKDVQTTQLGSELYATGSAAVATRNGLSVTSSITSSYTAFNGALTSDLFTTTFPASTDVSSGWFVPSLGEMVLLAQSIYGGTATGSDTEATVTIAGASTGYDNSTIQQRIKAAQSKFTKASNTDFLNGGEVIAEGASSSNPQYYTASEVDASTVWTVTLNQSKAYAVGKQPKSGTSRRTHLILLAK